MSNLTADPMAAFIELIAQARANRVLREFDARNSSDPGSSPTEAAIAPAETPSQETRHGAN
jgi:hypothetical protein